MSKPSISLLVEVEDIMNNRLLTPVSDHPQDLSVLTQSQFLLARMIPHCSPASSWKPKPMVIDVRGDLWNSWVIASGKNGSRNIFLCFSTARSGYNQLGTFTSVMLLWCTKPIVNVAFGPRGWWQILSLTKRVYIQQIPHYCVMCENFAFWRRPIETTWIAGGIFYGRQDV